MTHHDRKLLEASLRNDLASFTERAFQTVNPHTRFLPNWHHQAIAHHLELCRHGDINRLIITMPPRNGKSHCTSVSFTAFLLGHDPAARIINATYGHELTADFARQFRILVNSPGTGRSFLPCVSRRTPRWNLLPVSGAIALVPRSEEP